MRYRDYLTRGVLEIGCGAGRLTGYLAEVSNRVLGIDVSKGMLDELARRYPAVMTEQRDLRDIGGLAEDSFECVVAPFNILDVLDDPGRHRAIEAIHRIVAPGGLVMISTHNRAAAARITEPLKLRGKSPLRMAATLVRSPKWRRNRRRLLALEYDGGHYSILNDLAHDFEGLHYYIDRDAMAAQLAGHGLDLIECLDLSGRPVAPGELASHSVELHYVARAGEAVT